MFRLRRLYFDSVGVDENRFTDLTVELTDADGNPTDSIVWLRNGAGKTTMLSLLLALIRPDRREFLAYKTQNRTLEDLILGGDTAHVVAEWVAPDGRSLLTGAVYEWDGRTRPTDHNGKGKDRLKRSWWCITPPGNDDVVFGRDNEGATLETLPFTLRTRGAYDRERFCSHITALAAKGIDARVVHQSITQWHEALRERHFDAELFEYFVAVNSAEGGIDNLFKGIDSPEKFVRYLLRFVANPQQVRPVRDLLQVNAAEIAKKPMYQAEKDFCDEAQKRVYALGVAHAEQAAASRTVAEESARAGRYKRALLDASDLAADQADLADRQLGYIEQALGVLRSDLDMYRTRSYYYAMKAAEFGLAAAADASTQADQAAAYAALTARAWRAVEHHIALQSRIGRLEMKRAALQSRTQEAQPWQERVHAAQACLAGAIEQAANRGAEELREIGDRIKEQDSAEATAQGAIQAALERLALLEAEQQTIHTTASEFTQRRQGLLDRGVISAEETLAAATQRLTAIVDSAAAALTRIEQQRSATETERAATADRLDKDRAALTAAEIAHSQLKTQLENLLNEALKLGSTPRLRILMQTDDLDLAVEVGDVLDAVEKARADTEREIAELNEALAAGERALLALRTDKLLPPRLQVQKVIDELHGAGISADSGWKYLATHIPADQYQQVIEELPAVVDGVIVYSIDPGAAADCLHDPVEEAVVIAHVSVFGEHPQPYVVCGPARAQYDEAAAEVEVELRTGEHSEITARRDTLAVQRRDDDRLLASLNAFQASIPDDGVQGLRDQVEAAHAKLNAARQQVDDTKEQSKLIQQLLDTFAEEERQETTRKLEAEGARPLVAALATDEADKILPGQRRLVQIPDDVNRAEEHKQRAQTHLADARTNGAELAVKKAETTRSINKLNAELQTLPSPESTDLPIDAARDAVNDAEEELRLKFPEETLRREVDTAEKEVRSAAELWAGHSGEEQGRAIELEATTAAGDHAARKTAEERAQKAAEVANQKQGEARSEYTRADTAFTAARRVYEGRKSRSDPDLVEPTDHDNADELAVASDTEAEKLEVQRWKRDQEKSAVTETRDNQRKRAEMLIDQTAPLRHITPTEAAVDVAISDDDAKVRAAVQSIANDLDEAAQLLDGAEATFADCADDLAKWAGDDKFVRLAEDEQGQAVRRLREMLRDKASILRVAATADTLGDDLRLRSTKITEQLLQVEETKSNISSKLTDLVTEALASLSRASRLSELPEGIGNWDHRRFIDVAPRTTPSRDQIGLRVGDLIDSMVNGRTVESDPVELLWLATDAAVPEGFKARILKPTPEQSITPLPVSEMQKWSGAENLTASLMLFCVLARLRAEKRNANNASAVGGVLPLDNPVGKSSLPAFLTLHRKVARANGVQLVYWTGLGDLGAITVFPRIAAMRKRPSRTRAGRSYVGVDEDRSRTDEDGQQQQVLDIVSSVRRES